MAAAKDTGDTRDQPVPDAYDPHRNPVQQVGTPARDAAIDPRPEDFLAPTNAGEADPHGPEVVSPGLHGVEGVRPVRPGDVADEPDVQEADETEHTEEAQAAEGEVPSPDAEADEPESD